MVYDVVYKGAVIDFLLFWGFGDRLMPDESVKDETNL